MKTSIEKLEKCQVVLNIEAESEEMEKSLEQAYRRLASKAMIPGFRKGKAPRSILERFLGKDAIVGEALDQLMPELYKQALEENELDIIAQPEVEIVQENPLIFKTTVSVGPSVEIGDYHQIRIPVEPVEVSEEDINNSVEMLRERQAFWEPVERGILMEDSVVLNVEAECEGETILSQKEQRYYLAPGLSDILPNFVEQIQGMKIGEKKEFSSKFPDTYENKDIAGKEGHFKVSVLEIKEKDLPEVDDEFAKSLGQGIETLDSLRELVASDIKKMKERGAMNSLERKVLDAVVGLAKVDFPPVLVEEELDYLINDQIRRVEESGLRWADYLKLNDKKEEDIRDEMRSMAEERVTHTLVLDKVRELENIEIKSEEIDNEMEKFVEEVGYLDPSQGLNVMQSMLMSRKVIRHLVDIATKDDSQEEGGREGNEQ